ncbi:MAG: hypothetical protein Q8K72_01755 [Acidimicrobiales bacterium]|nr:hypothetical protein [Acidimicrobiales bacterium]
MPHCDTCDRFYNPNTLDADGSCPTCGRPLADPTPGGVDEPGAPWHFKLLLGATVLYLGFRFVQGIAWVGHHL